MDFSPSRVFSALVLRLYQQRYVDGVQIIFTDLGIDRDHCLSQLAAVFETLQRVDERDFAAVKRYVRHIVVWRGRYTAYDRLGGIHLSSSWLIDSSPAALASALVHEAAHLRIAKCGIKYEGDKRARIERVCVKQQAAFLRKVCDGGADLAAEVDQSLATPWWTDRAHRERVERLVSDAGLPAWLAPLLHRRS